MTDKPMKTPQRRPPGFPATDAVVALAPAEAPAEAALAHPRTASALGPTSSLEAAPRDPYAGAATKQVNTRLLEPLHTRYVQLVRELGDEGYKTSLTEILHALLADGPTTPEEARRLVRAWRRRREP